MSRTRHLKCPVCGKEDDTHWSMECGKCKKMMVEVHMLENTSPKISGGSKKESPTLIFKGPGWTEKSGG